jgi:hypothetical protein
MGSTSLARGEGSIRDSLLHSRTFTKVMTLGIAYSEVGGDALSIA